MAYTTDLSRNVLAKIEGPLKALFQTILLNLKYSNYFTKYNRDLSEDVAVADEVNVVVI